ncbi:MAG TPA: dTDP-4-dehydrorhamnose reductase [Gemmataceae bacterium]|nr:dTDP-4-dehydrorhamnose reductase [Gemmataceae bacterium]
MKYAVLGAAGQLGRDLCPRLGGDVTPLTRAQADLTKPHTLRETLTALRPDVVVNCAAYNFVDRAESEPEAAMAANGWGVKALAEVCRDLDCTLVHFSTDYVFGLDATRRTPFGPGEAPGPISVYGLSKLAGEYVVRATVPRHFVIRTCGLYGVWGSGGKGGNFVETMLRVASEGKPLRVVGDQECTPSYTVDIAEAAVQLIKTEQFGLHHLTNAGSCSWFELARTALELKGIKADLQPIGSNQWKAAARRPAYSVLKCQAELRPWQEAVAAYLNEREKIKR